MLINSNLFLHRVSLPGYQGNLQAAISHTSAVSSWERFGVEMVLTFVVVFTYFVSTNSQRKLFGNSAAMIGAAYSACNFVSVSIAQKCSLNRNSGRKSASCSTSQN
jgi:glycerol uptake facilitator-like aquaporin